MSIQYKLLYIMEEYKQGYKKEERYSSNSDEEMMVSDDQNADVEIVSDEENANVSDERRVQRIIEERKDSIFRIPVATQVDPTCGWNAALNCLDLILTIGDTEYGASDVIANDSIIMVSSNDYIQKKRKEFLREVHAKNDITSTVGHVFIEFLLSQQDFNSTTLFEKSIFLKSETLAYKLDRPNHYKYLYDTSAAHVRDVINKLAREHESRDKVIDELTLYILKAFYMRNLIVPDWKDDDIIHVYMAQNNYYLLKLSFIKALLDFLKGIAAKKNYERILEKEKSDDDETKDFASRVKNLFFNNMLHVTSVTCTESEAQIQPDITLKIDVPLSHQEYILQNNGLITYMALSDNPEHFVTKGFFRNPDNSETLSFFESDSLNSDTTYLTENEMDFYNKTFQYPIFSDQNIGIVLEAVYKAFEQLEKHGETIPKPRYWDYDLPEDEKQFVLDTYLDVTLSKLLRVKRDPEFLESIEIEMPFAYTVLGLHGYNHTPASAIIRMSRTKLEEKLQIEIIVKWDERVSLGLQIRNLAEIDAETPAGCVYSWFQTFLHSDGSEGRPNFKNELNEMIEFAHEKFHVRTFETRTYDDVRKEFINPGFEQHFNLEFYHYMLMYDAYESDKTQFSVTFYLQDYVSELLP